jgi:hypothetical protein
MTREPNDDFTETFAPGAFKGCIGKQVPFTHDGKVIGRARVLDGDGTFELTITDPDVIKVIRSIPAPYVPRTGPQSSPVDKETQ